MKMKNLKENNVGITLIALVLTIIILLLLAGITLSLIAGSEGILGKASNAVDKNEKATAEEQAELLIADYAAGWINNQIIMMKNMWEKVMLEPKETIFWEN